jgi:hypothetical protein
VATRVCVPAATPQTTRNMIQSSLSCLKEFASKYDRKTVLNPLWPQSGHIPLLKITRLPHDEFTTISCFALSGSELPGCLMSMLNSSVAFALAAPTASLSQSRDGFRSVWRRELVEFRRPRTVLLPLSGRRCYQSVVQCALDRARSSNAEPAAAKTSAPPTDGPQPRLLTYQHKIWRIRVFLAMLVSYRPASALRMSKPIFVQHYLILVYSCSHPLPICFPNALQCI